MQRTLRITAVGIGFGLALGFMAGPAIEAHHAFAAEFDSTKPVVLRGTITKMEWINPHSWLHLEVKNKDGTVETWMIEAGPPGALVRRGWKKDSVIPGTEVLVEGYQALDGSRRANGRDVTFPDGTRLFAGSSGTGAPRDGRDSTEK
jgi:hypothetical protein